MDELLAVQQIAAGAVLLEEPVVLNPQSEATAEEDKGIAFVGDAEEQADTSEDGDLGADDEDAEEQADTSEDGDLGADDGDVEDQADTSEDEELGADDAESPWLEATLVGADGFDFIDAGESTWETPDAVPEWDHTDKNPVGVEITLEECEADTPEWDVQAQSSWSSSDTSDQVL